MTKGPRRTLIAVGVVSLLMALGGVWYNVQYLSSDYSGLLHGAPMPLPHGVRTDMATGERRCSEVRRDDGGCR